MLKWNRVGPNEAEPLLFERYVKPGRLSVLDDENRLFLDGKERCVRKNPRGYCFFDLTIDKRRRTFSYSRLVWMIRERREIPKGFEIDHDDEVPSHNWRRNLICVYRGDHWKLHERRRAPQEEVPF